MAWFGSFNDRLCEWKSKQHQNCYCVDYNYSSKERRTATAKLCDLLRTALDNGAEWGLLFVLDLGFVDVTKLLRELPQHPTFLVLPKRRCVLDGGRIHYEQRDCAFEVLEIARTFRGDSLAYLTDVKFCHFGDFAGGAH